MKDYKYLAASPLVEVVKKRDKGVMVVSTIGSVLMMGCWVWFLLGLVA